MSAQLRLSAYAALATMATATALISVFSSSDWVVPVMGAILIVAASCALVRSSPLPAALEPIVAAIAVLCWVTLLDARSKAHFGFIPGRLALRTLGRTARHGFTEIHQLPTPAPAHHGLVLLTVVGVAAVALVVDLMTVTLRRAALSGLPLLGLFTVCAATGHHGVGIFPFIAAAIGYLWLLFADNREKVARWGAAVGTGSRARPASAWSTDESSAPAPASLGRRVAAAAIGLGVVVPLFIPGLHTGIDKHGTGGGGSGGSGNQLVIDPIVSVAADLQTSKAIPVISYQSSSPDPGYLRLTSLDMFNGTLFSSASSSSRTVASEDLPVIPPEGPIVTSTISVSPELKLNWLPAEATALGVSVGNKWRYDGDSETIFSAATTTAGLRYTTKSVANVPTAAQLNTAPPAGSAFAGDLIVPASVGTRLKTFTKALTAKARTRYEAALDIQSFFRTSGHFTYDTNIPANKSPNALADFVLNSRKGFCQQFATAMAVMARMVGIPSRVAVGFTAGTKQPDGSWVVTTHDAHAWPELYFRGFGWLPFEPTPRPGGQAVPPPYSKGAVNTGPRHNPTANPTQTPSGQTSAGLRHPIPGQGTTGGGGGKSIGSLPTRTISAHSELSLIVAIALLLIVLLPGTTRVVTRQRRWRRLGDKSSAADAAWAELRDTAIDLRVPWDDGHTPRQIAATVVLALRADPATRASMQRLAHGEERSRYAPTSDVAAADLQRDVTVIRVAAAARRTQLQRVLARVVPRSTMRVFLAGIGHLGDVFELFDRLGERVRHAFRTKSHLGSEPTTIVSVRP